MKESRGGGEPPGSGKIAVERPGRLVSNRSLGGSSLYMRSFLPRGEVAGTGEVRPHQEGPSVRSILGSGRRDRPGVGTGQAVDLVVRALLGHGDEDDVCK